MIRLSARLGVRPNFARLSGTFDVGRLDDVAAAVAAEVTADSKAKEGEAEGIRVVSYPGVARVRIENLAARANELLAKTPAAAEDVQRLPEVPALHWVGLAKRAGVFEWVLTAQHLTVGDEQGRKIVTKR